MVNLIGGLVMDNKRKVMVLCPVRNEESNLKRFVPVWQLFADYIVIVDQCSEDNTRKVLSQFNNVIVVDNQDTDYHEGNRNVLLVNKAREITSNGIFVYLDADETLSANILHSPEWQMFCEEDPGTVGAFQWVTLWKTPFKYIDVGSYVFAFIDDGRRADVSQVIHGGVRGVGVGHFPKTFFFNEIVNLHFTFVNYENCVRKNNWYKARYIVKGAKKYYYTNRNHNWFYYVKEKELRPTPREWLDGYINKGIDVTSTVTPDLLWYDIEILRWFNKYGVKKFYLLDIWRGIDWEEKRKIALARVIQGIPSIPIKKPNRLILFYNGLGTYNFSLFDLLRKIKRVLLRIFLP